MTKQPKKFLQTEKNSPLLGWVDEYDRLSQPDKSEFLDRGVVQEFGTKKRKYSRAMFWAWCQRKSIPSIEVAKWAVEELSSMHEEVAKMSEAIKIKQSSEIQKQAS